MANFTVVARVNLGSIFKAKLVMLDDDLHMFQYNILLLPSDYSSFPMSSLYGHLTNEDTHLPSGYCLYGDNAYVNDTYMAVPYPSTSSGPKDA